MLGTLKLIGAFIPLLGVKLGAMEELLISEMVDDKSEFAINVSTSDKVSVGYGYDSNQIVMKTQRELEVREKPPTGVSVVYLRMKNVNLFEVTLQFRLSDLAYLIDKQDALTLQKIGQIEQRILKQLDLSERQNVETLASLENATNKMFTSDIVMAVLGLLCCLGYVYYFDKYVWSKSLV